LLGNKTGGWDCARLDKNWRLGDKTGSGERGMTNDVDGISTTGRRPGNRVHDFPASDNVSTAMLLDEVRIHLGVSLEASLVRDLDLNLRHRHAA
jgi:hypothetical protein